MTRQEFILGYFSGRRPHYAIPTADGYRENGRTFNAARCVCGQPGCEGWRMVEVHHPETTLKRRKQA